MDNITLHLNFWTQRLRAIAQTGLAFDTGVYDRERYEEMLQVAAEMAAMTGEVQPDLALAEQLYQYWRAQVLPDVQGYVTPKVGIGAVVFNDRDELLLIQRPSGHWLFPTGWADVGYSPAEVAVKEVREETGLQVTPVRLIAVYDIRRPLEKDIQLHFYSLVFYCRLDGGKLNRHLTETLDAGFFSYANLPEGLARRDFGWVELAWAAHRGELTETYFDKPST